MAFGVRVDMAAIEPEDAPTRARTVLLSLQKLGRGPSQARLAPQPAKLTFHATGFSRIREPDGKESPVGSLEGTLEFDPLKGLKFLLEREATLQLEQPLELGAAGDPKAPRKRRRAFKLVLERQSFPVPLRESELLLLPDAVVEGCRFLELRVELEIGGTVESSKDLNGVLDTPFTDDAPIPISPQPFRIAVRDHLDQPLPNTPYQLELDGELFDEVTDGEGFTLPHETRLRNGRLTVGDSEYEVTFFEDPDDDEITEFQSILNALGFRAGELTGTFNRPTEDAIAAFQRKAGLAVSGRLNEATKTALREKHDLGALSEGPGKATV